MHLFLYYIYTCRHYSALAGILIRRVAGTCKVFPKKTWEKKIYIYVYVYMKWMKQSDKEARDEIRARGKAKKRPRDSCRSARGDARPRRNIWRYPILIATRHFSYHANSLVETLLTVSSRRRLLRRLRYICASPAAALDRMLIIHPEKSFISPTLRK